MKKEEESIIIKTSPPAQRVREREMREMVF